MYMLLINLILSLGLCTLLLLLYNFSGYTQNNKEVGKASAFECGFEGYLKMRRPFSIRYFILVILFLIFDVETVLLFPCLIGISTAMGLNLLINMMLFLVILMVGLLYEWKNNMLDWT